MRWVSDVSKIAYQPTANIQLWLTKPYILSDSLKRVCDVFSLVVLSQSFIEAPPDDRMKLRLGSELPFVREVELRGDGVRLTYGRVTIPYETYHNHSNLFSSLDNQPIGEKILYNNPNVKRSAFEYAFLSEKRGWARRSLFFIQGDPLLVTELMENTLPLYRDL